MLLRSIVIAGALAVAAPAHAVETYDTVGGWAINIADTNDHCFMFKMWNKGTAMMLTYHPSSDRFSIILGNDNWSRVTEGSKHSMTFVLDGSDKWTGTFIGLSAETRAMRLTGLSTKFIESFMMRYRIDIYDAKGHVTGMQLDGSFAAMASLVECTKAVTGALRRQRS